MRLLRLFAVAAGLIVLASAAGAKTYDLVIAEKIVNITGKRAVAIAVNGTIPGPTLRWREGEIVTLRVTNRLKEDTSIHWHGLLVPFRMDGVPTLSFKGIKPGQTFTYRFKVRQHGTYWYHSHSGLQEQSGVYGSIVIKPSKKDTVLYDRQYVIVLSDWSDENPHRIMANLKRQSGYYNYNKQTLIGFIRKMRNAKSSDGRQSIIRERLMWGRMRMDPTDIADISGATYTYLMNGRSPGRNWTALFRPGQRIRLRFINAAAMTYFDVKIPGLKMQIVQADGQDVRPVTVDEFRIAVAETYDVIVQPKVGQAYTIFARSMDRSGYARGTLAPRRGMRAGIPPLGKPPVLRMTDMGPASMPGMGGMNRMGRMAGMSRAAVRSPAGRDKPPMKSPMSGRMGKGETRGAQMRVHAVGAASRVRKMAGRSGPGGYKKLTYADLRGLRPNVDRRKPSRVIVLRLTGNMERYFWTINNRKYSDAKAIKLRFGERVRIRFVNETMMAHPMHLHGMWSELRNGNGRFNPKKHTISVGPGQIIEIDVTADAVGQWAFHCHLLFHMETGMFRKVVVAQVAKSE